MRYKILLAMAGIVSAASPASAAVQLRVSGNSSSLEITSRCGGGRCTPYASEQFPGFVNFDVFAPDSVLTNSQTIVSTTSANGLTSFEATILNNNGFLSAINLKSVRESSVLTPDFSGVRVVTTTTASNGTVLNLTAPAVPEPATWAMMLVGFGMVGASSRYRRRRAMKITYA